MKKVKTLFGGKEPPRDLDEKIAARILAVEETLEKLVRYDPYPLVKLLPAGGGRRVPTYMHLFCGGLEDLTARGPASGPAGEAASAGPTWREDMERQMADLKAEMASLRAEVNRLREELGG